MDAKAMIDRNNKAKTQFFRKERTKIQFTENVYSVTKDEEGNETKKLLFKKGHISNPHTLMAEQYIIEGVAKEV